MEKEILHDVSPFGDGIPEKSTRMIERGGVKRSVDVQPYVKVYPQAFILAASMPAASVRLFSYVCSQLRAGHDEVSLGRLGYIGWLKDYGIGGSAQDWYRGMPWLIENGILAAKDGRGTYWANPSFVFRGDRMRLRWRKQQAV